MDNQSDSKREIMMTKCLLCLERIGRDFATKTINGVDWALHRCLIRGCANEVNKMTPQQQEELVRNRGQYVLPFLHMQPPMQSQPQLQAAA
jgi:hypothetical protein